MCFRLGILSQAVIIYEVVAVVVECRAQKGILVDRDRVFPLEIGPLERLPVFFYAQRKAATRGGCDADRMTAPGDPLASVDVVKRNDYKSQLPCHRGQTGPGTAAQVPSGRDDVEQIQRRDGTLELAGVGGAQVDKTLPLAASASVERRG